MSDRYLCKAKRTDNGEWVEGYYVSFYSNRDNTINEMIFVNYQDEKMTQPFEVDTSTLCQSTGLPDKNGKIIFRGDVVKRWIYKKYIIGEVVWLDVGFCGFYLNCGNNLYPIGKGEDTGLSDCDEIIGNIFDNPELLEGGAE